MQRPLDQINKHVVVDTCAVWNVLSSGVLHRTCVSSGLNFVTTQFVIYECLVKVKLGTVCAVREILRDRLRDARTLGQFETHSLELEDLQEISSLEERRQLGKGELAAIAFAKRCAGIGFQTDDMKARKLGEAVLTEPRVQTTSHLLGYLFFEGRLVDVDLSKIIDEHEAMNRPLRPHFKEMYEEAMRCRLMARDGRLA